MPLAAVPTRALRFEDPTEALDLALPSLWQTLTTSSGLPRLPPCGGPRATRSLPPGFWRRQGNASSPSI